MIDKNVNRKKYTFQGLEFEMKIRSLDIRKQTLLFLNDFLTYSKQFGEGNDQLLIAAMTYFSDETKLKELFNMTLESPNDVYTEDPNTKIRTYTYKEVDKISYDADEDEKFLELLNFAVKLFMDFFSLTLPQQTKTVKKSKN